jgi:hypothetical protein
LHVPPTQVGTTPGPVGQTCPQKWQLFGSFIVSPQSCAAHDPPWQLSPLLQVSHALPDLPHAVGVAGSTHVPAEVQHPLQLLAPHGPSTIRPSTAPAPPSLTRFIESTPASPPTVTESKPQMFAQARAHATQAAATNDTPSRFTRHLASSR